MCDTDDYLIWLKSQDYSDCEQCNIEEVDCDNCPKNTGE